MYVDEVNEVPQLHEDGDEGYTTMAAELYPFQVDEKGWDICWKALNCLDESHCLLL